MRRRALALALAGAACALCVPAPAGAMQECKRQPETRTLAEGMGMLESAIMDPRGRLLFTDEGSLLRMARPGAEPEVLVPEVDEPGGLAYGSDGFLYVGFGNSIANGATGKTDPRSGLLRVDPLSGESSQYVTGLSMANGVVRGPDGSLYASNDVAGGIDRVAPDGTVELTWADVNSANGLVIDRARQYLFAAQTFQSAAIARVDLAAPSRVETYYSAPSEDLAGGLDGMVRDRRDRLYVAANGSGEIWRVNRRPQACSLASMPPFPDGPAALTFGRGRRGFDRENLYVVTFAGTVIELADVRGPRRR
jgi:sugar lactone lactonase YvrE